MTFRHTLACGAAVAALAAGSAHAATINLIDTGGLTGSAADAEFHMAAAFWGAMLNSNVTINIGAKIGALPANVIGSTHSFQENLTVSDWEAGVQATKSNSVIDQTAVLPTLNSHGGASFITDGNKLNGTTDATKPVFDNGTSTSSQVLFENTAVMKAIGLTPSYNEPFEDDPMHLDAQMTFSSDFAFDYDPTNGIDGDKIDFLGVAIHEMGHALGFVSGVDYLDYFGSPKGPGRNLYDINTTSIFSALDMFRYSTDPSNKAPGTGPVLDESVGTASYFSINGGLNPLFGSANFSTGTYNGDKNQASHWKESPGCGTQLGIMDPTFCFGQSGDVTALDVAAFDAIGWNLAIDATAGNGSFNRTTAQIFANNGGIPEPSSWVLSIAGFGLMGAAMRRRRQRTAAATA